MKKIILIILCIYFSISAGSANLVLEHDIQTKIDRIGTRILNTNKIQTHIVFTYNKETRKNVFKTLNGLTKSQIIMYDVIYQHTETDDEIAGELSRQIYFVDTIYSKFIKRVNAVKDPKFYELTADKKAVDYMVNANYNPLALITYINKTNPENKISLRHNKTSDRLMAIYEYILLKYPKYLNDDNPYLNNSYFQNFLLNTVTERKLLQEKLNKSGIR